VNCCNVKPKTKVSLDKLIKLIGTFYENDRLEVARIFISLVDDNSAENVNDSIVLLEEILVEAVLRGKK
jgi:hypothetical protein